MKKAFSAFLSRFTPVESKTNSRNTYTQKSNRDSLTQQSLGISNRFVAGGNNPLIVDSNPFGVQKP